MPQPLPAPSAFLLPVGDGHRLFVETWGNPLGSAVLVLHGGPGSGTSPRLKELYDPQRHYAVFFDQRGAGRSEPAGDIRANTTAHLLADIEAIRRHLGIARWCVTGGSWGACLALLYAAAHPHGVSGVVVRSVFMPGPGNIDSFFRDAARLRPQAWQALIRAVPEAARMPPLCALAERLGSSEGGEGEEGAIAAAAAWSRYEQAVAEPLPEPAMPALPASGADRQRLVLKYRIQAHYLKAGAFIDADAFLRACEKLSAMPVSLIHGRMDLVCPPDNARAVHARIPGSHLVWVDECGHQPFHPAMLKAWRQALA